MAFRLIDLTSGEFIGSERSPLAFEDGKRAARAARLATAVMDRKVQVRKCELGGDANWREREQSRLDGGEYSATLPELAIRAAHVFPDHFPHTAKKRPDLIAYTKNDAKGREDKQSLISVRAYIDLIEAAYGNESAPAYREALAERVLEHANAMESTYKVAVTPDEIALVYVNYSNYDNSGTCSTSCMRYPASHFNLHDEQGKLRHPAEVYGAGDLGIAYLSDDDGRTTARCLVWPEQKMYSRMYGGKAMNTLHALLRKDGYTQSHYYDSSRASMSGAKLLKVPLDGGGWLMPYLDECHKVRDLGDHFVLAMKNSSKGMAMNACETSGYIGYHRTPVEYRDDDEDGYYCSHCEDSVDDEDDLTTVWLDSRQQQSEQWCPHCRDSDAFYCHGSEEYYHSRRVDSVEVDGDIYTLRYAENHASYCDGRQEFTFDDTVEVVIDDDGRTERWGESYARDNATLYNERYYCACNVTMERVVVERYVPRVTSKFHGYSVRSTSNGRYLGCGPNNVWYYDREELVPACFITRDKDVTENDDGVPLMFVVEQDGKLYKHGYVDNYPVYRPRLDNPAYHPDQEELKLAA